ncbi:hypothetical protein C8Q80DRAFT_1133105 [Daedaleopsis nitida]|nr:hypothetical protein C8Q80DRAFT_1133105 [Daedaleopsis nitida]
MLAIEQVSARSETNTKRMHGCVSGLDQCSCILERYIHILVGRELAPVDTLCLLVTEVGEYC